MNRKFLGKATLSFIAVVLAVSFLDKNFAKIHRLGIFYGTKLDRNQRILVDSDVRDFRVEWTITLGDFEFLLESDYLKAGLEQSIKDIINNDIRCEDVELNDDSREAFYSVKIKEIESKEQAVRGNGKCKGNDKERCKKRVKKSISDAGKEIPSNFGAASTRNTACDTTIFDMFEETLITASYFNYQVDIELIEDVSKVIDLQYKVEFEEFSDGLDKIEDIDLVPSDPKEIQTFCSEPQCIDQGILIREIYSYYGVDNDFEHECLFPGINCDINNLVTHIWLENYGFPGKSILDAFGKLTSLEGLLLGGNQLNGTVPLNLCFLQKLKVLWLQDNELSGEIPSELGNLRGLKELNLRGNNFTSTIPSDLGRLGNLRIMNLGRNNLTGTIPKELGIVELDSEEVTCKSLFQIFYQLTAYFRKNVLKLRSDALDTSELKMLQSLSLYENSLSGGFPDELSMLKELEELSFAKNTFNTTITPLFGEMRKLVILDLRKFKCFEFELDFIYNAFLMQ